MLSKFISHWKDYPDFAILQAVTTGLVGKPHIRDNSCYSVASYTVLSLTLITQPYAACGA